MNNIEEDIKILEEFIEGLKQYDLKTGKDIEPVEFGEGQRYVYKNVYMAIFNVLSEREQDKARIKELEVLEDDLKDKRVVYIDTPEFAEDYIPVQKIKDKIEEIEKEYNEIISEYGNIDTDVIINVPDKNVRKYLDELVIKILVLQELLEEK